MQQAPFDTVRDSFDGIVGDDSIPDDCLGGDTGKGDESEAERKSRRIQTSMSTSQR